MYYHEPYTSCYVFGALRYFSALKSSVCLVHGPTGCAFFSRNSLFVLNGYFESDEIGPIPKVFTTGFNDNDVIFGGKKKLRQAILEINETYKPDLIFVLNCCVTEVIGENIEDVTESLKEIVDAKMVAVHGAGFKGDQKVGMREAGKILFEEFFLNKKLTIPMTINFLGDFNPLNPATKEFKEILQSVGIQIHRTIPGNCSREELETANQAALNFVMCGNAAKNLARLMEENLGMPYIGEEASLFGLDNTYKTTRKIFDFFGIESDLPEALYNDAKTRIKEYKEFFNSKRVFVIAGTRRTLGYSSILKELGAKIEFIFTESSEDNVDKSHFMKFSQRVLCDESPQPIRKLIEKEKPDFVITTLPELIMPEKFIPRTIDDFSGFEGTIRMAELLKNYNKLLINT